MDSIGNIKAAKMLTEMRSMAMQAKGIGQHLESKLDTITDDKTHVSFSSMLKNAVDNVNQVQQSSDMAKQSYDLGDPNISIGDVMIKAKEASLSFQALVRVRNKFIDAYKDIMNMQW